MNSKEIAKHLYPDNFQPFALVTKAGERYEIYQRTMLKVMTNGTMHVHFPSDREDAHISGYRTLNCSQVQSIEPLQAAG